MGNLITTSRKPSWSGDGLFLCMVAGQSKDKSQDAVHVFHRSSLTKKVSTILLPESSHATAARFNPKKLKMGEAGAAQGFFDVDWSCDGRWLVISDGEGFITRVHVNQE